MQHIEKGCCLLGRLPSIRVISLGLSYILPRMTAPTSTLECTTRVLSLPSNTLQFDDSIPWWQVKDSQENGNIENNAGLTILTEESRATLDYAANLIIQGCPVGVPTETVYGLSANALSATAVKTIYAAKERPADNPLIVHIASLSMLNKLVTHIPDCYWPLLKKYWPGPLTVLLPVNPDVVPTEVTCGLPTVAVRFPAHPAMRSLIIHSNCPLAAPSANKSGRPSPTLAEHVLLDLNNKIPLILDSHEPCQVGLESTVIDSIRSPPVILRPGGITAEQVSKVPGFENVLVYKKDFTDSALEATPTTPGMKYLHYSPKATVVLFEGGDFEQTTRAMGNWLQEHNTDGSDVCMLRLGKHDSKTIPMDTHHLDKTDSCDITVKWMGETNEDVGHNLFSALREMDLLGAQWILAEGVDETGTGMAVMNRLRKSASYHVKIQ